MFLVVILMVSNIINIIGGITNACNELIILRFMCNKWPAGLTRVINEHGAAPLNHEQTVEAREGRKERKCASLSVQYSQNRNAVSFSFTFTSQLFAVNLLAIIGKKAQSEYCSSIID